MGYDWKGFFGEEEYASFRSMQTRVPTVALADHDIEPAVLRLLTREQCERHRVVPVSLVGTALIVAMTDPENQLAAEELRRTTGFAVEPVIATESAIRDAIAKHYRSSS